MKVIGYSSWFHHIVKVSMKSLFTANMLVLYSARREEGAETTGGMGLANTSPILGLRGKSRL